MLTPYRRLPGASTYVYSVAQHSRYARERSAKCRRDGYQKGAWGDKALTPAYEMPARSRAPLAHTRRELGALPSQHRAGRRRWSSYSKQTQPARRDANFPELPRCACSPGVDGGWRVRVAWAGNIRCFWRGRLYIAYRRVQGARIRDPLASRSMNSESEYRIPIQSFRRDSFD